MVYDFCKRSNQEFYGYDKDAYENNKKSSSELKKPYWLFKAKLQKPPKCYYDIDQDISDFIFNGFNSDDIEKFTAIITNRENKKHSETRFKSLDCTIMNLADNISYSLHDLEDALSLNMISERQWKKHFEGKENLFDAVELLDHGTHEDDSKYKCITGRLFSDEGYIRKGAIGCLVNFMITNVTIEENGSGCMHPLLRYEVKLPEKIENLRKLLCDLVFELVIMDRNVQQLEFKGQKTVIELFQVLSEDPERFLPERTKIRWKNAKKQDATAESNQSAQLRVICDFIAGMTDAYAIKFYQKVFTPNEGSIFDRL